LLKIQKRQGNALRSGVNNMSRKIVDYGLLGLLVITPLLAGSVYEWSILLIQLSVLVMMTAYLFMDNKSEMISRCPHAFKYARFFFLGLFIFIFVQIIPLPISLVKVVSPEAHSLREMFSIDFSRTKLMSLSLLPNVSLRESLELLSYFLLGFLIIKTVTSMRQIKRIVYVLIGIGVFEALYGFFELYKNEPRILFFKKIHYLDAVTGTFVNRNHLSGYLEMVIPLTLGLIITRLGLFSSSRMKWRDKVLRLSEKGFASYIILCLSLVIMGLAVIFSKSRTGVFLLVFTFLLFLEMAVLYFGKVRHQQVWIKRFLVVTFMIISFAALYIGVGGVMDRFAVEDLLHEGRPSIWTNVTGIISGFPLFGSGLGTFSSVYPVYEKIWRPNHLSHAHNDYLEYLSELGAVGLFLLLGGIILLLARVFLIWRGRKHPEVKGIALGGMIAVVILLIHSFGDFNLHIPSNMLLFAVVLSLTAATVMYKRRDNNQGNEADLKSQKIKDGSNNIRSSKRNLSILLICILLAVGILEVLIYWNQHLYYKANKIKDIKRKINILKKANRIYPHNDLIYYELGKAHFSLGLKNLQESNGQSTEYLGKSLLDFEQSLRINPISRFSHFYFGRSLLYMSYLSSSTGTDYAKEFEKAARLAGHHSKIYYEVGKIFLACWHHITNQQKDYTVEILKKALREKSRERIRNILQIWAMNVKDYSVIRKVLPRDMNTYRLYAGFLGEKCLSIDERFRFLALAESLEFEKAKKEFRRGENALIYSGRKHACGHFRSALNELKKIKFYQNLSNENLIDLFEFKNIKGSCLLNLAKCRLLEGKKLDDVKGNLHAYLVEEVGAAEAKNLDLFLRKRGLIKEDLSSNLDDLTSLFLRYLLCFKQNRYRDIMNAGSLLKQSFVVVPESQKQEYVKILQIIGDSFQKEDFFYEAADYYQMAMNIDPDNLSILFRMRKNFDRLNEDYKIWRIDNKIRQLLSQREITMSNSPIKRGKLFSKVLTLSEGKKDLQLHFYPFEGDVFPLISVFFNGRVVFENYLNESVLVVPVEAQAGDNRLEIIPINREVDLFKLSYNSSTE
jgi:O-antigen ligase